MIDQKRKNITNFWLLAAIFFLMGLPAFALEWEDPVEVSTGLGDDAAPATIVVDPNNNAAIIWIQGTEVYTSYRPFTGSWEAPTVHTKGTEPQICMDDAGNTTIAFITEGDNIVARYRPAGGSWSAFDTLATSASTGDYTHLSLTCIDTNFYAYAAWNDANGGTRRLRTAHRRTAGSGTGASGWDTANIRDIPLGGDTATPDSRPLVKVLSDGNGVVVSSLEDGSSLDLYESTTTFPGGIWSTLADLDFLLSGLIINSDYVFEMRPNGNGIVAASTDSAPIREIHGTATVDPFSPWPIPNNISQSGADDSSFQVAVDDNGVTQAIWVSMDGSNDAIAHKTSTAAGNVWSPTATSLNLSFANNARLPVISTTGNGFAVVGWLEDPNATFISRSISNGVVNPDGPFTIDANIQDVGGTFMTGTVAASDSARGFAAWIDDGALNGFVESTGTDLPDDPVIEAGDLLKALSKKRLIYQKGLYP